MIHPRKANTFRFRDDGRIPDHLAWPLIRVRFGGHWGRLFMLEAGDVAVLPTGVGH